MHIVKLTMSITSCNILKYLNQRLRLINYTDPRHNNKLVAFIISFNGTKYKWFRLKEGDNIISNNIKIIWSKSGFNVKYKDEDLFVESGDHESIPCEYLIDFSIEHGYFVPKFVSSRFKRFLGLDFSESKELLQYSNKNSSLNTADTQWIFWVAILIIVVLLIFLIKSFYYAPELEY